MRVKVLPWSFGSHGAVAHSALYRSTNQATQYLQLPLYKKGTNWNTICHQLRLSFLNFWSNSTILYGKLDPEFSVQSKTQILVPPLPFLVSVAITLNKVFFTVLTSQNNFPLACLPKDSDVQCDLEAKGSLTFSSPFTTPPVHSSI